jgi:hypothetical protein
VDELLSVKVHYQIQVIHQLWTKPKRGKHFF